MTTKNFTGIAKERRNGWWAQCDQLPVVAHGKSFNEALQAMIESIELYYDALEGAPAPRMDKLARGDGASAFRLTVALP